MASCFCSILLSIVVEYDISSHLGAFSGWSPGNDGVILYSCNTDISRRSSLCKERGGGWMGSVGRNLVVCDVCVYVLHMSHYGAAPEQKLSSF